MAGGNVLTANMNDYLGGHLLALLAELPSNNTDPRTTSAIVNTHDGVAIVAVGNVAPTTRGLNLGTNEPRFLVMAKHMTNEFIAQLGEKFVVKNMRLLPKEQSAPGGLAITNRLGESVGELTWDDRRPGDSTRELIQPTVFITLSVLMAVLTAIAFLCWWQFRDIGERERKSSFDARHDALTGLLNRPAIVAEIDAALAENFCGVCVLFIDLDGFKVVNDTYDHRTGDHLLCSFAAMLRRLTPAGALASRIGGDEFVVLFRGVNATVQAETAASRIIDFLQMPFDFDGRIASIGASIGIAAAADPEIRAVELLRRADIAMYRAKSDGKNRCCVFTKSIDADRGETLEIVSELRAIVARKEIDVAYQPIVDAFSRKMTGVEALARWPGGTGREVGPERFIADAETAGIINQLGETILERVCADAKKWADLHVAINISPLQLRDPEFVSRTLSIIDRIGLAHSRIELEITEGTLIDDVARLKPIFAALRLAGISLALDDFGAGYSSIAYLRELPFDRIKIDRSLTSAILTSGSARHMIQATGLIARGIGAEVTAEGVEAEEEIQMLKLAGCAKLQGYFFGKPQDANSITRALSPGATALAAPHRRA
jgi:diguanylate cyclase (GGDEF)-like protein